MLSTVPCHSRSGYVSTVTVTGCPERTFVNCVSFGFESTQT
jgi:hypothetical protein